MKNLFNSDTNRKTILKRGSGYSPGFTLNLKSYALNRRLDNNVISHSTIVMKLYHNFDKLEKRKK